VLNTLTRSESSQTDIEAILTSLTSTRATSFIWFAIRTDLNDTIDSKWSMGVFCPSARVGGNHVQFVTKFCRSLFPKSIISFFTNPHTLEDDLWDFLFPINNNSPGTTSLLTLPPGQIYVVSDIHRSGVIEPSIGVKLSEFCRRNKCCFVTVPETNLNTVMVYFFNPDDNVTCRICPRVDSRPPASSTERTVYAFMKAEIVGYLKSNFPGYHYRFVGDVVTCAELVDDTEKPREDKSTRRRSSDDVLSPPTFEKYNKGASKRTRNFPDEDPPTVALFP